MINFLPGREENARQASTTARADALRASSADERERHRGISHHSRTVLGLCSRRHVAVWPLGFGDAPEGPSADVQLADGAPGLALLQGRKISVTSMGRTPEQDPLFFHAASAAGSLVVQLLKHL